MADIGKQLTQDTLTLIRGRDFKWTLDSKATPGAPAAWPAGELFLELDTGGQHNALQEVSVIAATGGTYKLGVNGILSAAINYYTATVNPYGIAGGVQAALEAVAGVGIGNVLVYPAKLYPVWEIDIKLNAGHNEVQQVKIAKEANGGQFGLGYGLAITTPIPFGSTGPVVKTALEAIPAIGTGSVIVTKIDNWTYQIEFIGTKSAMDVQQITGFGWGFGWGLTGGFFPAVTTSTLVNGLAKLTEPLVNTINKTVNDVFNSFEALLGVDLEFVITDARNAKIRSTSMRSFVESDIITFATDVTNTMIQGAITNIAQLAGLLETVTVTFYWNHIFQVEFVGALAQTEIPKMTTDTSALTGTTGKRVETVVIDPGKARLTKWPFTVAGSTATIKVESEKVDLVPNRTRWQLVHKPTGEAAGGDALQLGVVYCQPR